MGAPRGRGAGDASSHTKKTKESASDRCSASTRSCAYAPAAARATGRGKSPSPIGSDLTGPTFRPLAAGCAAANPGNPVSSCRPAASTGCSRRRLAPGDSSSSSSDARGCACDGGACAGGAGEPRFPLDAAGDSALCSFENPDEMIPRRPPLRRSPARKHRGRRRRSPPGSLPSRQTCAPSDWEIKWAHLLVETCHVAIWTTGVIEGPMQMRCILASKDTLKRHPRGGGATGTHCHTHTNKRRPPGPGIGTLEQWPERRRLATGRRGGARAPATGDSPTAGARSADGGGGGVSRGCVACWASRPGGACAWSDCSHSGCRCAAPSDMSWSSWVYGIRSSAGRGEPCGDGGCVNTGGSRCEAGSHSSSSGVGLLSAPAAKDAMYSRMRRSPSGYFFLTAGRPRGQVQRGFGNCDEWG
jgi:hypothetical protein